MNSSVKSKVAETQKAQLLALGRQLLLARQHQADKLLSQVTRDGLAIFVHGHCLTSLERHSDAGDRYEQAGKVAMTRLAVHCGEPVRFEHQGELTKQKSCCEVWPHRPQVELSIHSRWDVSGRIAAMR